MKIRAAAKGRSLFRLAAAALLLALVFAPQIAAADAAGYPETRDRVLGFSEQVGDRVHGSLSRLSHLRYCDPYDENAVGSLLVPGSGFRELRATSTSLRDLGVSDRALRRQIIGRGLSGPIGSDTPVTLARAHKLFVDPVSRGKRFAGRLGNLDTRVSTVNEAMAIERSGLVPRFEFRVGNRYADIVGLDRARHPARVLQLVKQVRPGVYNPRELPAALAIQRSLSINVEFIVTGAVR